jgi:hypothetical protein
MQQKELATLLDISPAMVSRLAKRGMPTDSLERAERWRKRHLEPGRVKGSRFGTARAKPPMAANPASPTLCDPPDDVQAAGEWLNAVPAPDAMSVADLEATGHLIDDALAQGNTYAAAVRTHQLREQLRTVDANLNPRLTLRVWLALNAYMLHAEAEVRSAPDMGTLLTPGEYGRRVCPAHPWPAHVVLFDLCDFDDNALNGWPDGDGSDDD